MADKFTFKKQKRETGLSGVGYPNPNTDIKFNKKVCGTICAPNWQTEDHKWRIRLAVMKPEGMSENCDWKWISFKARFDTEQQAREWLQQNVDSLLKKYQFHDLGD